MRENYVSAQFFGVDVHEISPPNWGDLLDELLKSSAAGQLTVLSGPSGSGSSFLLKALARTLNAQESPHICVDGSAADAALLLSNIQPEETILLNNIESASDGVLAAIGQLVLTGTTCFATSSDQLFSANLGGRIAPLLADVPAMEAMWNSTRFIEIPLLDERAMTQFLHANASAPLTQIAVSGIRALAWGRPEWGLDLLKLHDRELLNFVPFPSVSHAAPAGVQLSSLNAPLHSAEVHFDEDDIAAAIVLAEIGPRSHGGITDVVGPHHHAKLLSAGFIVPTPDSPVIQGVPELYATASQHLSPPEVRRRARTSAALHLMKQEAFGIPLNARETAFCAFALDTRTVEEHPELGDYYSTFLRRKVSDLVAFGDGDQARDIMLRLGTHSARLPPLMRARIATVLRDAPTGLQTIIAGSPPLGNGDDPIPNSSERIAMLMLRGRLAAESGLPFTDEPRATPSAALGHDQLLPASNWDDACLVIKLWNTAEPVGDNTPELIRIAQTHLRPEIALLAEVLLNFLASPNGARLNTSTFEETTQRITQLALSAREELRDIVEGLAVGHGLSSLLDIEPVNRENTMRRLVDHLPGAERNLVWATHMNAARTAIVCGEMSRAKLEWAGFAENAPRFLPYRISALIKGISESLAKDSREPSVTSHRLSNLIAYFGGHYDRVHPDSFAPFDPTAQETWPAMRAQDISGFRDFHALPAIRAHVEALQKGNPAALMRSSDSLESYGMWAPAISAVSEARRIYLRRRASGSVTAADARIRELSEKAAIQAPWFKLQETEDASREQLTPRETTTARLASEGFSNREIAEQMSCSVRTVESHLAQARAKLGASNRKELTHIFSALNPAPATRPRVKP